MDLNLDLSLGNDQIVEVDEADEEDDNLDLAGHGVIILYTQKFNLVTCPFLFFFQSVTKFQNIFEFSTFKINYFLHTFDINFE